MSIIPSRTKDFKIPLTAAVKVSKNRVTIWQMSDACSSERDFLTDAVVALSFEQNYCV